MVAEKETDHIFDGFFIDAVAIKSRERFFANLDWRKSGTDLSKKIEAELFLELMDGFYSADRKSNILDRIFKSLIVLYAENAEDNISKKNNYMQRMAEDYMFFKQAIEQIIETSRNYKRGLNKDQAVAFFGKMICASIPEFKEAAKIYLESKGIYTKSVSAAFRDDMYTDPDFPEVSNYIKNKQKFREKIKESYNKEKGSNTKG